MMEGEGKKSNAYIGKIISTSGVSHDISIPRRSASTQAGWAVHSVHNIQISIISLVSIGC